MDKKGTRRIIESMQFGKIYHENCIDTLRRMDDDLIDMTITSPPYDDLREYNGYHFPVEEIAAGLFAKRKRHAASASARTGRLRRAQTAIGHPSSSMRRVAHLNASPMEESEFAAGLRTGAIYFSGTLPEKAKFPFSKSPPEKTPSLCKIPTEALGPRGFPKTGDGWPLPNRLDHCMWRPFMGPKPLRSASG